MKRRLLLATVLGLFAAANGAYAHDYEIVTTQTVDAVQQEITWYYDNTTLTLEGVTYTGVKLAEIKGQLIDSKSELPSFIQHGSSSVSVIEYGGGVFANQLIIEEIGIPNNILRVGDRTFANCPALRSVSLGTGMREIGSEVFANCASLQTVKLNYGLRYIGKAPFSNTAVSQVELPISLLDMYGNVTAGALYCTNVTISAGSAHFVTTDDGCIYNKDKTRLYYCPTLLEGTTSLPTSLTEIMPYAFYGCFRLTYLNIPANVDTIGAGAFNVSGYWPNVRALESAPKLMTVFYQGATNVAHAADDIYGGAPADLTSYTFSTKWTTDAEGKWKGRPLVVATSEGGHFYSPILTKTINGLEWHFRIVDNSYVEIYNSATESAIPRTTADGDLTASKDTKGVEVPAQIYEYPVTRIGQSAFRDCSVVSRVFIPATVTEIGDDAFRGCSSLKSICSTDYVGATYIPEGVTLPEGIELLGYRPFAGTKMQQITFPATLTSVTNNPIAGCNNINTITVSASNSRFKYADGVLYNYDQSKIIACLDVPSITLLSTVTEIGDEAFANCTYSLTTIEANCNPPNASDDIFAGTLTNLTTMAESEVYTNWIPYRVSKEWKGRPFQDLSDPDAAPTYTDGNGVVWTYAITNNVATIVAVRNKDDAALMSLTYPSSIKRYVVKTIGAGACANLTGVTSVEIPSTYETIGDYAFSNCTSLATVKLNSGLRYIGKAPFAGTAITALELPATLMSVTNNPVAGCAFLTSLTVADGSTAFAAADNVLYDLGKTSLLACTPSLTSVTLPDTLTSIADDAFAGCTRLTSVTFNGVEPTADADIFASVPLANNLIVYANSLKDARWETAAKVGMWKGRTFVDLAPVAPQGDQIYRDADGNAWVYAVSERKATLKSASVSVTGDVVLPESLGDYPLVDIASNAFVGCVGITSVTLPASVTNVSGSAFVGCVSLTAFDVSASNACYRAMNGVLYSKDGTTLVKVPALFAFATTMTQEMQTTETSIIEVINGFDANLNPLDNTIVVEEGPVTTESTVVRTFAPAITEDTLMRGVTYVGAYAFADCGELPSGSTVTGTLITTTDGQITDTEAGTITLAVGTDATNEVTSTTTTTRSGLYNAKPANWKTLVVTSSTHTHEVPKPDTGAAVCDKDAWTYSVWETAVVQPEPQPQPTPQPVVDVPTDESEQPTAGLHDGDALTVFGGVDEVIETGLDSTTVKSVKASGLPSGLRLVKTTDKATKVATWTLQGVVKKSSTKAATLTITHKDGTKEKMTVAITSAGIPNWLSGEFNGIVYGDVEGAQLLGSATAKISTAGKLSGKISVPAFDNATKAKSYTFTMKAFSDCDAQTKTYTGTATLKVGSTKHDVRVTCTPTTDGTGLLAFDMGDLGSVEMVQNIWKRKDLTAPSYVRNASVTQDGITYKYQTNGKVKWSGYVTGDDGKSLRVSGTSQLLNDATTLLLYVPPKRNLAGGVVRVVDLAASVD